MTDADYFKPHQEGPIFVDPDAVVELQDDVDTFLAGVDRDTEAAVAGQNVRDMAEASFRLWLAQQMKEVDESNSQ